MNSTTISVGAFGVNCIILAVQDQQAIIIDPGADPDAIDAVVRKQDLHVQAYLLTHGHMDHISALAEMCRRHPAPIRMHPKDAAWAFSPANQMPPYYHTPEFPDSPLLADLTESTDNHAAGLSFSVLETPGHSPGSVCILFPDHNTLLTGDTLFAGSAGRTDFPGGDPRQLQQSLLRLQALPDSITIYPGHGPRSTIGHEKKHNLFMQPPPQQEPQP